MSLSKENICFRQGCRRTKAEKRNLSELDEYQLSPGAPYIYVEKYNVLSSKDIVEAKRGGDEESGYYVTIEFAEDAVNILNRMCNEEKFPILVMFIKGVPFYTVYLRGPFDQPVLRWDVTDHKDEAELLTSSLNEGYGNRRG